MPTDPGLLNRFVKVFVTYPQMRRAGVENPRLQYAREHRSHIGAITELLKEVFKSDDVKLTFLPFLIRSWNINLLMVASITRRS
jgi:hypothetical protein